jgi:tetratricopeptide (TPR) repeat protein
MERGQTPIPGRRPSGSVRFLAQSGVLCRYLMTAGALAAVFWRVPFSLSVKGDTLPSDRHGGPQPSVQRDAGQLVTITVDYPEEGSIFPPEFPPPTFLWRDPDETVSQWKIEVAFADGAPALHATSPGERMRFGEIDPRCIGETNELPKLTPQQAAARTWTPDIETWEAIKKRSVRRPASVTITGVRGQASGEVVSRGGVSIQTSKDPVGAPIFYRDVPLMPSEVQKGVIKPLAPSAGPLIAWRLRNVGEGRSRLLMEGLHTCANCHSFSRDGRTLGLDVDGPQNDKGLYALVAVRPVTSIRNEDVIAWSSFRGKLGGRLRVAFMPQVSPDGQYVVATINDPGADNWRRMQDVQNNYYVANFKDYRFLQVFYATRGVLAWYSKATGRLQPLPGADDPAYVQTNAAWSPDGKSLVFARAQAKDSYPADGTMAEYANDPKETKVQYDLYRIPFNAGLGGRAERILGASRNGMSNSFPRLSPDGRWIVFVESRNAQLMRPDSQLYIVPAKGGQARRMRCNTRLMNSWHSFSPNGRWMVFSSKSRTPYTEMFLTHLDDEGNDSPAILIENATAANRAVNLPEFVNIPPDGLLKMEAPASEFYRVFDQAAELSTKGRYEEAVALWRTALELGPREPRAHNGLGAALVEGGQVDEAIVHYRKALEIDPDYPGALTNLGLALARQGKLDEAIPTFEQVLRLDPEHPGGHTNLGAALLEKGRGEEAVAHCRRALEMSPGDPRVQANLAMALASTGKTDEAIPLFEQALLLASDSLHVRQGLAFALLEKGRRPDAIPHLEKALALSPGSTELHHYLGFALVEEGRRDEAIPHLEAAVAANPGSAELRYNLGRVLVDSGRLHEAIAQLQRVILIAPGFASADYHLGSAYHLLGETAKAAAAWRDALRKDPNHLQALNRLARVLATSPDASQRNGTAAVELAERAAQLSRDQNPAILETLAAAYGEVGRFAEAVKTARRALELATQQDDRKLAATLGTRVALYEARRPLRER